MKISVITVTVEPDDVTAMTAASVEAQTYPDVEHIVIDGCGKDRSSVFPRSRYFQCPRAGVYNAINIGIGHATGDIIGILHAGDRFASGDVLENISRAFDDPEVDFTYADIRFFNPKTGRTGRFYGASAFRPSFLTYGLVPPHPSLYIRRGAAGRVGPYKEDFEIAADFDMWIRLFTGSGLNGLYLPATVVEMASNGASSTLRSRLFTNNYEKLRALRLNGLKANPFRLLGKYVLMLRKNRHS